jgi:hypothetical protein
MRLTLYIRLTTNEILDVSTIDISHFGSLNDPLSRTGGHLGAISFTLMSDHQLVIYRPVEGLTLFARLGTFGNERQDPESPIIRP